MSQLKSNCSLAFCHFCLNYMVRGKIVITGPSNTKLKQTVNIVNIFYPTSHNHSDFRGHKLQANTVIGTRNITIKTTLFYKGEEPDPTAFHSLTHSTMASAARVKTGFDGPNCCFTVVAISRMQSSVVAAVCGSLTN